ncbi:hypothetical protein ACFW1A_03920 [Kitasatospora sp. NPDC058965]|uniref:hypothetical protein n=1 Tax=Kitasatospora sp. NPDC058965 TaxID=3346682 RepID=UPI00369D1BAB
MIRRTKRARRLLVGELTYLWTVRHQHRVDPGPRYRDCTEVLVLRRYRAPGRLLVRFRGGPGRAVADGYLPSGAVGTADHWLNLHEPGTARGLLDLALARGWRPEQPRELELDGWDLMAQLPR